MNVLDTIVADVERDLARRQERVSLEEIKRRAHAGPPTRDAVAALRSGPGALTVIAEVKRCCPSRGHLATIEDPGALAAEYQAGGAAMVSCLTEGQHFGGSFADLAAVRARVTVPVLCKDFIISPYQIHEARAHGADMVLLVVGALTQPQLEAFVERANSLGMSALVEAHSRLEVCRALDAGAQVIGVNARDLTTLEVDRSNFAEVVDLVPADVVAVAESGVRGPRDVFEYAQAGADAVLVGETLVRSTAPREQVADMVAAGCHPAVQADRKARVKRTVVDQQLQQYRR